MPDNLLNTSSYLPAGWPDKPENVSAITTLKKGGFSRGAFSEYNLALHVDDDVEAVKANRSKLIAELNLPAEPVWLEQVHSNNVICADEVKTGSIPRADASVSRTKGVVCAVMTADCLPVFFCNQAGTEVAVAHAGWRGLHAGILSQTVNTMRASAGDIQVYLGAAIGPQSFEVGEEVFHAFVSKNAVNEAAFVAKDKAHYLCDIYQLARIELQSIAVNHISGGDYCTYDEEQRFYSYRRQQKTGRMASLIWLQ